MSIISKFLEAIFHYLLLYIFVSLKYLRQVIICIVSSGARLEYILLILEDPRHK